MKSFVEFLRESLDTNFKLSDKDKDHLISLDKKYGKIHHMFDEELSHFQDIVDIHRNIEDFKKTYKEGKVYFPDIEYEKSKFDSDNFTENFIKDCDDLIKEFNDFQQCYLFKFYIDELEQLKARAEFYNAYSKDHSIVKGLYFAQPSEELYRAALECYTKNAYVSIKDTGDEDKFYKETHKAKDCIKIMQDEIDRQGYGWKVILDPHLVPRMSVKSYKEFDICAYCNFSDADIESLIVHEINTHICRKANGNKLGLNLMLYGVGNSGDLDEGMAILNSLGNKHPKLNILYYISQKIIINYWMNKKNFNEIYDFLIAITPTNDNPDQIIKYIIREHRCTFYTLDPAYSLSQGMDYFIGYEYVKDLPKSDRETLMKYNIGKKMLPELPNFIKFFKENKFKPL